MPTCKTHSQGFPYGFVVQGGVSALCQVESGKDGFVVEEREGHVVHHDPFRGLSATPNTQRSECLRSIRRAPVLLSPGR